LGRIEDNSIWVRTLEGRINLGHKTGPLVPYSDTTLKKPCSFTIILRFVSSSWSKKKEPRYACLSDVKASRLHRTWTEVSSSVPLFLQVGLLFNPFTHRCLLRVLCPVRRPVADLDCVLLKDSNWTFVARLGSEINSRTCLCVLQGSHQIDK